MFKSQVEFFGFFNMVGKFATIFGPLLMTLVPFVIAGATARDSILALSVLFIGGGYLLFRVDTKAGAAAAQQV